MRAFHDFGMPLINIEESDFAEEGTQYVMGVAPVSLDFLTSIYPLDFDSCWNKRVIDDVDGIPVNYLEYEDLVVTKQHVDRDEDRADLRKLKRFGKPS